MQDTVWAENGNKMVCKVAMGDTESEEQANARLIASAPELLAALFVAERYMRPAIKGARKGYVSPELAIVRAAIAKANGGTPSALVFVL